MRRSVEGKNKHVDLMLVGGFVVLALMISVMLSFVLSRHDGQNTKNAKQPLKADALKEIMLKEPCLAEYLRQKQEQDSWALLLEKDLSAAKDACADKKLVLKQREALGLVKGSLN